jgi:hypothetical protein
MTSTSNTRESWQHKFAFNNKNKTRKDVSNKGTRNYDKGFKKDVIINTLSEGDINKKNEITSHIDLQLKNDSVWPSLNVKNDVDLNNTPNKSVQHWEQIKLDTTD